MVVTLTRTAGFNPFDPIQDTESATQQQPGEGVGHCFNPFDPIQDTERMLLQRGS